MDSLCHFILIPIAILTFDVGPAFSKKDGLRFRDLPVSLLLHHIELSHHLPCCVLYRNKGKGSQLESELYKFWQEKDQNDNATYNNWQLGSFAVQDARGHIDVPAHVPCLTCYLGPSHSVVYNGRIRDSDIRGWFQDLARVYTESVQEGTLSSVSTAIQQNDVTILGFPDADRHLEIEEMLFQIRDSNGDGIKVLIIHQYSPDIRELQSIYKVAKLPSVLLIHKHGSNKAESHLLEGDSVTRANIEVYLQLRHMNATVLTKKLFEQQVVTPKGGYQPILVCFYTTWANQAKDHLYALQRTVEYLQEANSTLRFGTMDIETHKEVLHHHFGSLLVHQIPFTVLYFPVYHRNRVESIEPRMMSAFRPTISEVLGFLLDLSQQNQLLKPYIPSSLIASYLPRINAEVCLLTEGPWGEECGLEYNNQTDTELPIIESQLQEKNDVVETDLNTEEQVVKMDVIELSMVEEENKNITMVTESTWSDMIETSPSMSQQFPVVTQWKGDVTKVTLVIFIIEGCGSCRNNMEVFHQLHHALQYIEGASALLANCTSDPLLCKQNDITGFPSVSIFRGLGWLTTDGCISGETASKLSPVRLDYHGVIRVTPIMDWFLDSTHAAVNDTRFHGAEDSKMVEDVHLVATLVPKMSGFLPHVAKKKTDYFLPYECFRLACELLYGQVPCYTEFSKDIPEREFSNKGLEMVATKIVLHRKDGMSAVITQLGETLVKLLEREQGDNTHIFHAPHKYNIPRDQKCEDNHAFCTDLIVDFTRDHARLPITKMTSMLFHSRSKLSFLDETLPVMVALVHAENMTISSQFYQNLREASIALYNSIQVISVDVDEYASWAGQFVPANYITHNDPVHNRGEVPLLYKYPRLCIVHWTDHHHAAFYPPIPEPSGEEQHTITHSSQDIKHDPYSIQHIEENAIDSKTESVHIETENVKSVQDDNDNVHSKSESVQNKRNVDEDVLNLEEGVFSKDNIIAFANAFAKDPKQMLIKTNHF
ncbi:unnamed protein product [Owenia fusiformis]|uniref:Thioredoxin domain-containing protein n=1 Tax=Owenia fusiformis TaxID=6347 RepID=A0A8S4NGJ4_OWEFU|nr:unnamed protein product [Owenia fusiformis]